MRRTAYFTEVIITERERPRGFPVVGNVYFRVGAAGGGRCGAFRQDGGNVAMRRIRRKAVRAVRACEAAICSREFGEQAVKSMILLNEDDDVFYPVGVERRPDWAHRYRLPGWNQMEGSTQNTVKGGQQQTRSGYKQDL